MHHPTAISAKNTVLFLSRSGFGGWFSRLQVGQKIGFGYAMALGIAVVGTVVGFAVGNAYQSRAQQLRDRVQEETALVHQLETNLLQAQMHQQSLMLFQEPDLFWQEAALLREKIATADRLWTALKMSQNSPVEVSNPRVAAFAHLVAEYNGVADAYFQPIESQLQYLDPFALESEDFDATRLALAALHRSGEAAQFRQFLADLGEIVALTADERQAADAELAMAARLRTQIVAVSVLVSMAIATLLAFCTSRAIAQPIQSATSIAQRATRESNFELQVPITTNDEVGLLTDALNQLMLRVRQLLAERKSAEVMLVQTEKMSSLGRLAAGVAHEINNPVSFIHGNVSHTASYVTDLIDLLQRYQQAYPQPALVVQQKIEELDLDFLITDLSKCLTSMKLGTERIRQIVLSLRHFTHLDEAAVKEIDLHQSIDNTLVILNTQLKDKIDAIKHYGIIPQIECHPVQMNQVLMHLLSNAAEALLEQPDAAHKQIIIQTEAISRDRVTIKICDNGPGIAPEIQDKIFEPFFTTKPIGQGTGLGLATCYEIVKQHGGKIMVNSQLGHGAEFAITLPIRL